MGTLKISNISSCDFTCTGTKLRVKESSVVIDSTSIPLPNIYTSPQGTIPQNLKENSIVIEVFSNKIAYWTQTSCDEGAYTWSIPIIVDRYYGASATDTKITFINSAENGNKNVGTQPHANISLPLNPSEGDTLVVNYANCFAGYYTYTIGSFLLTFTINTCENKTFFENSFSSYTNTTTDKPSIIGNTIGDTAIVKYAETPNGNSITAYWTWNGISWDINYVLSSSNTRTTHLNDLLGAVPIIGSLPTLIPSVLPSPSLNDTVNYKNGNVVIWYTYNGTQWVEDFRITIPDITNFSCTTLTP